MSGLRNSQCLVVSDGCCMGVGARLSAIEGQVAGLTEALETAMDAISHGLAAAPRSGAEVMAEQAAHSTNALGQRAPDGSGGGAGSAGQHAAREATFSRAAAGETTADSVDEPGGVGGGAHNTSGPARLPGTLIDAMSGDGNGTLGVFARALQGRAELEQLFVEMAKEVTLAAVKVEQGRKAKLKREIKQTALEEKMLEVGEKLGGIWTRISSGKRESPEGLTESVAGAAIMVEEHREPGGPSQISSGLMT